MVKQKLLERNIEQLIDLGKKKGYLTYDEINHFLSEEIVNANDLDLIFDRLDNQNISILEAEEVEELERKEEKPLEETVHIDDPVKMYLKQMGQIPLLSREEEIKLAREIEEEEESLRNIVHSTLLAKEAYLEISKKLVEQELNLDDFVKGEVKNKDKEIMDEMEFEDKWTAIEAHFNKLVKDITPNKEVADNIGREKPLKVVSYIYWEDLPKGRFSNKVEQFRTFRGLRFRKSGDMTYTYIEVGKEYNDIVLKSASSLLDIINDILDFSKN